MKFDEVIHTTGVHRAYFLVGTEGKVTLLFPVQYNCNPPFLQLKIAVPGMMACLKQTWEKGIGNLTPSCSFLCPRNQMGPGKVLSSFDTMIL